MRLIFLPWKNFNLGTYDYESWIRVEFRLIKSRCISTYALVHRYIDEYEYDINVDHRKIIHGVGDPTFYSKEKAMISCDDELKRLGYRVLDEKFSIML